MSSICLSGIWCTKDRCHDLLQNKQLKIYKVVLVYTSMAYSSLLSQWLFYTGVHNRDAETVKLCSNNVSTLAYSELQLKFFGFVTKTYYPLLHVSLIFFFNDISSFICKKLKNCTDPRQIFMNLWVSPERGAPPDSIKRIRPPRIAWTFLNTRKCHRACSKPQAPNQLPLIACNLRE